ncbi:hypothetical protein KFL_000060640 [Klebsormidium nitens]|uniref:EamA domain-containing protein n=1 Tax=Klebsormidium nitens TaxID=105231 RepID=A0A0U9HHU4_KLENI|nr:hypothetical protein KFL_000060640 [Klebsormidium nitens]|eukprot:GAQ77998.1 hypothetical protein KFL_000060640 [Klebsormidium nitens]
MIRALLNRKLHQSVVPMRTLAGLLLALTGAIFNGTTGVFGKLAPVRGPDVDLFVFHFWACVGVALTATLVLLFGPVTWTPLGLLSGGLLALSLACSFTANKLIGVSLRAGIANGTAALVSFVFGLFLDPNRRKLRNLPVALAGLSLLMGAIVGIAYAGERSCRVEEEHERVLTGKRSERVAATCTGYIAGLFLAVLAGTLGALTLAPMQYAPSRERTLRYLPSMAVEVILLAPIVDVLALAARGKRLELKPKQAAPPGIAAGFCRTVGIAASILSIRHLGYTLAYPILQSSTFVAGLWGILVFHEMKDPESRKIYWLSGLVLLAGVTCLPLAR